jgi:hypothetical protein
MGSGSVLDSTRHDTRMHLTNPDPLPPPAQDSSPTVSGNAAENQSPSNNRQKVYLGTPQTRATLWDAKNSRPTVFSRELDQLKAGGYTQQGDYMLPPSN